MRLRREEDLSNTGIVILSSDDPDGKEGGLKKRIGFQLNDVTLF